MPACSSSGGALDLADGLWNKCTMSARAQVLFAAVCFGTTGTAQALGPAASPVAVGAARIVLGGAMLVAVARAYRRTPAAASAANVLAIAVGVAVYQLSFFAAVKLTGVAVGTVVAIGTGPAAAGALGRLVNGERLTARWGLATACAPPASTFSRATAPERSSRGASRWRSSPASGTRRAPSSASACSSAASRPKA